MSTETELRELWGDEVYSPYVAGPEDRRRWDICHQIATTMSEVCEPDGRVDNRFVWFMERQLWASDLPTDDEEPAARSPSAQQAGVQPAESHPAQALAVGASLEGSAPRPGEKL